MKEPNFVYYTSVQSSEPGYLQKRMVIYKEMIESEQNRGVRSKSKDIRIGKRNSGSVSDQQKHSEQSPKFVTVSKKG